MCKSLQLMAAAFFPTIKSASNKDGRSAIWNCRDQNGTRVIPGIYFYRVLSDKGSVTGKVIVR
ncbi:MAG TPA: T9SS type A sorting domain-containing protein [bacterium]